MASRSDSKAAAETLEEIESIFDRAAEWVANHPREVLIGVGVVLGLAALAGGLHAWQTHRSLSASVAVAAVDDAYMAAMGGAPGSIEPPEPANPEVARQIRSEYVDRFLAVATEHPGTAAAVAARLEAGGLQDRLGDLEAAVATWREAAEDAPGSGPLRSVALARVANGLERLGKLPEAAAAWAEAGRQRGNPAAGLALIEAARCYADAGDREQALALFAEAEAAPTDAPLPPYLVARLTELRARG